MEELLKTIEGRHSERGRFDPRRRIGSDTLRQILEAGRWAPTPHNMQNFEVIVVDDKKALEQIGNIRSRISEVFLRENYKQFSFSREELLKKKRGVLSLMFPEAWRDPAKLKQASQGEHASLLKERLQGSPMLLFVVYDSRIRAPASEGDVLGFIGLGCVMENMWLMAESLGVGFHVLSAFSDEEIEKEVRRILKLPRYMKVGFTARLGYPTGRPYRYLRVRREISMFAHHNKFGVREY